MIFKFGIFTHRDHLRLLWQTCWCAPPQNHSAISWFSTLEQSTLGIRPRSLIFNMLECCSCIPPASTNNDFSPPDKQIFVFTWIARIMFLLFFQTLAHWVNIESLEMCLAANLCFAIAIFISNCDISNMIQALHWSKTKLFVTPLPYSKFKHLLRNNPRSWESD